jgi:(S)-2-hydroxy-acid oxidase
MSQYKTRHILSIDELEKAAMPLAQKQARDYWQSGANEMQTVRENKSAFDNYRIRARALRDVSRVFPEPKLLFGHQYRVPIGFAPSAFHQMATDDGELATARAAKAKDWPMALSSYSTKPLDEVKAAGGDSVVFLQLYVFKNRKTTEDLVRRAEEAGYKAILLTVDTPIIGRRYSDIHNNFKLPGHLVLGNFLVNASGPVDVGVEPTSGSRRAFADDGEREAQAGAANVLDPSLNWEETIPWLRSITKMEIWVKGIATAEDAELAVEAGVDGIWVSNHGGRQLDSTLATLDALPEVVEAVKGRIPVHVDGGVRRGGDVFKALALGADFVWLGRPVLYGLQYDGQNGVELMVNILEEDFRYVMALSGNTSISQISKKSLVRVGPAIHRL